MRKHKNRTRVTAQHIEQVRDLLRFKGVPAVVQETGVSSSKVYQIRRDSTPRLRIRSESVTIWTDGRHIARYATVEVAAVSKVEAVDCWAWADVLSPLGPSFPLHWAGTAYSPDEASAPRTTINPREPARLDVAVALPPPGRKRKLSSPEYVNASGQITAMGFDLGRRLPIVPNSSWYGEGCWLGHPVALYNPDPRLKAYLSPGEYRIKITVGCSDGEGEDQEFILVSPFSWEGLQLRGT